MSPVAAVAVPVAAAAALAARRVRVDRILGLGHGLAALGATLTLSPRPLSGLQGGGGLEG